MKALNYNKDYAVVSLVNDLSNAGCKKVFTAVLTLKADSGLLTVYIFCIETITLSMKCVSLGSFLCTPYFIYLYFWKSEGKLLFSYFVTVCTRNNSFPSVN